MAKKRARPSSPLPTQALHAAIRSRDVEAAEAAIKAGANVNEEERTTGLRPLSLAIGFGNVAAVRLLLKHGAGSHASDLSHNLDESLGGFVEVTRLLLEHGADPNAPPPTDDGTPASRTPLMAAVALGRIKIAQALLDAGADPDRRNDKGETALDLAIKAENDELVDLLRKVTSKELQPPPPGAAPGEIVNYKPADLLKAARKGELELVRKILIFGMTPDATTALAAAAEMGRDDVVKLLLIAGASPQGVEGYLPLALAARNGFATIVKRLLDAGAQIDAANSVFGPALCEAAGKGHLEIVELLLRRGAGPGCCDHYKHNALWHAQDALKRALRPYDATFPERADLYRATVELLQRKTSDSVKKR